MPDPSDQLRPAARATVPFLYTIKQAAKVLQVSESLVRKLITQKELGFVHVGCGTKRTVRIPEGALEEFVERRKSPPAGDRSFRP